MCLRSPEAKIILLGMKQILTGLFLFAFCSFSFALSVEEVIHLSKLNTSDELLLEILQTQKLDHSVTAFEIVTLKEAGVNERVIQYILKLSRDVKVEIPRSEGESVWISDELRSYQTRDKNGKLIRVVTNLDENGKRMGGEIPPDAFVPEDRYPEYVPEEPREIFVTVRQEDSGDRYPEDPPQATEVYGGIPLYSGYSGGFFPGFVAPHAFCKSRPSFHGNHSGKVFPGVRTPVRAPLVSPRTFSTPRPPMTRTFAGARPAFRR